MHEFLEFLWVFKNVLISIGAVAIFFYTVWYFTMSNWRKYPAGRRVLGFTGSLVAVMGYTVLALLDGDTYTNFPPNDPSLLRVIVGTIVYGLVAYSTIRLDITLLNSWRKGEVKNTQVNPFLPEERTDRRRFQQKK